MLVRDRFKLTQQALSSLGYVDSLTILDDRSENKTADFLRWWGGVHHAFVARNDSSTGTGRARNAVIEVSQEIWGRGDYLYLSDNDVIFTPTWLQTLIDCYEAAWSSGCRVLGAVGHPYHQHGETLGICSFNVRYAVQEVLAQPLQSMLMRWEVWDEFGPFEETEVDKVCDGEDVKFSWKLAAAGYKMGVVNPPLLVNTGITNTFGDKIPGWELVKEQAPEGVIVE